MLEEAQPLKLPLLGPALSLTQRAHSCSLVRSCDNLLTGGSSCSNPLLFLLGKEVFFCDFLNCTELEPESLERLSGLDVLIIDEEALLRPRDSHIEEFELRAELLIAT